MTRNNRRKILSPANMTRIAVLGAIASVLFMWPEITVIPPFYKLDFSTLPVMLGAFSMGIAPGVLIVLLKNLIGLLHSGTGGVGELADFIMSSAMIIPAVLVYQRNKSRKGAVLGLAAGSAAMILTLAGILPAAAHAENFQFITDIRVEAGEDAYDELEDDGYSVRAVGLNAASGEGQIYLGYKINDGDPVTNVVISADVGDAFDSEDGIHYVSAGHVDTEAGNGEGGGCVYMTQDPKAGAPLVGLDILRAGGSTMGADLAKKEPLLPITNDGAEIVRKTDGTPADLEVNSADTTIYLAGSRRLGKSLYQRCHRHHGCQQRRCGLYGGIKRLQLLCRR